MHWFQTMYGGGPGALMMPFGSWGWTGFSLLLIWSLVWKGLALWKSARREESVWFVALLVLNTLGILEILYLFVFSRDRKKHQE